MNDVPDNGEAQDEMDSYDLNQSLKAVIAATGHEDLKDYKEIVSRKYNIDTLAAAKLLTNQIEELKGIIAYTPAIIRPTEEGEALRSYLIQAIQSIEAFRDGLVYVYRQDDGYEDIQIETNANKRQNT